MNTSCLHATSGCDYPAGECAGHCVTEKQPEALRLADELCTAPERSRTSFEAAAELRRLHSLNVELLEALQEVTFLLEASLKLRGEPHPGSIGAKARALITQAESNT